MSLSDVCGDQPALQNSPFGLLPSLVPMLEFQHFLDVQLVLTRPSVLRDLVDQHYDLGDWAIHPVEQPSSKGTETFSKRLVQ